MLLGTVPFKAPSIKDLRHQVVCGKPDYKDGIKLLSGKALNLIKGILEKDPQKRLTIEQILNHDWMTDKKEGKFSR
jgi:serine/threonine protein kinase